MRGKSKHSDSRPASSSDLYTNRIVMLIILITLLILIVALVIFGFWVVELTNDFRTYAYEHHQQEITEELMEDNQLKGQMQLDELTRQFYELTRQVDEGIYDGDGPADVVPVSQTFAPEGDLNQTFRSEGGNNG